MLVLTLGQLHAITTTASPRHEIRFAPAYHDGVGDLLGKVQEGVLESLIIGLIVLPPRELLVQPCQCC